MSIVRKSVAFNCADPDQVQMFNHAMSRTNFSAYVKRLIQRDMECTIRTESPVPRIEHEYIKPSVIAKREETVKSTIPNTLQGFI